MTKKLILIGLFCLAGQQLVCQDTSDLRAGLQKELINKQKEQLFLEQQILKQGEVIEHWKQKYLELCTILQANKKDQMSSKSLFAAIYNTTPINPPGFKAAWRAEFKRIMDRRLDDYEPALLTREQVYFFKFYSKKYVTAQDDLEVLLAKFNKIDEEINEIKNKLN